MREILLKRPASEGEEPLYLDSIAPGCAGSCLGKVVCYTTAKPRRRIAVLTQFREKTGGCYYGFKSLDRLFKVDGCELFFEASTADHAIEKALEDGKSGRKFYTFYNLREFLSWAELHEIDQGRD